MAIDYWGNNPGGYGPNSSGRSGNDPRGRSQNMGQYVMDRYESQQGPLMNQAATNYARSSEADWNNYNDIMAGFKGAAGLGGGGGGGGGATGYGVQGTYTPFLAGYKDPFKSYSGFEEFSKTGGYSPEDIANMRARGASPIRAAYANAEREIGRQRSLQGGYAPNAIAAQTRMAREQGQATADAIQGVEAGLASERQQGRLAGLTGMSGIEGQRLGADVDISKFNAGMRQQAQSANISAAERAAASRSAASGQNAANRMEALTGARLLYGTTPGMSSAFGNTALGFLNSGGEQGLNAWGREIEGQRLPGRFDQTMDRTGQLVRMGTSLAYPWLQDERNRRQQQSPAPYRDSDWQGPRQSGGGGQTYYPEQDRYSYE